MTQTDYTTRVLRPEPGMFLTQAGDVPLPERIVTAGPVYLAANDSPENWRETDAAEAGTLNAAIAAAREEARRRMEEETQNDL